MFKHWRESSQLTTSVCCWSVGDQLSVVKMSSCGGWQKLHTATLSDVEYWTWLSGNTIALVTDRAVFHWVMEEGMPVTCYTGHVHSGKHRASFWCLSVCPSDFLWSSDAWVLWLHSQFTFQSFCMRVSTLVLQYFMLLPLLNNTGWW